jgi:CRP-like cAMP-binding protein
MREQARDYARSIFHRLDDAALDDLLQAADLKTYPAESFLCHEGAQEETFYIIVTGKVHVFQQLKMEAKTLVAVRGPGEYFGETGLVLGRPRNADVITAIESVLLELSRDTFTQLTRKHPEVAWELSRLTVERESETKLTIEEKQRLDKLRQVEVEAGSSRNRVIFTSYAHADEVFVKQLVRDLQRDLDERSITLWLDQVFIRPGHDWDTEIEQTLESAAAMLLVLSGHSVESKNVKDEWSYFLEQGKPILPVLKEDCKVPFRLRTLHFIDFTKLDYTTALARVHAALAQITPET